MKACARARYVRSSPRKLRRVVELVRGRNVNDALDLLHFMPKKAARMIEKTLQSAVANLIHKEGPRNVNADNLVITKALIDGGPMAKRFHPGPMGRASRIRKRFSHITLYVGDEEERFKTGG
ncbi:hypothetical protein AMJ80_03135 [bacterium SM23_31]|nr:MAG: hypothetical protein AMJ80_03135 [bacterium SM23_31]